jgi:hypothetical protein
MASHKTLLYLGTFFIIFDIIVNFPEFSVSYFGILLVLIGYFKWKIYGFIMFFIWIGITIEVIYDIYRVTAKGFVFLMNKARSQHKVKGEEEEEDGGDDDASSVASEPVVPSKPKLVASEKKKKVE